MSGKITSDNVREENVRTAKTEPLMTMSRKVKDCTVI